jgi:hypothetical protein
MDQTRKRSGISSQSVLFPACIIKARVEVFVARITKEVFDVLESEEYG